MSSALGVVQRDGGTIKVPAINKGRCFQFSNNFCIFSTKKKPFQQTWCSFWWLFLLPLINSTQFYLKCVINFAHNLVIGLVIKSEHCFQ